MSLYHKIAGIARVLREIGAGIRSKSRRRRVYHQFRRNCISPTACRCISSSRRQMHADAWWYTRAQRALDDIPTCVGWYAKPAAWIKKYREQSSRYFLAGVQGFEPRKCQSQSLMPYRLATPQYFQHSILYHNESSLSIPILNFFEKIIQLSCLFQKIRPFLLYKICFLWYNT